MSEEKWYGVDYVIKVDHATNSLDLTNMVNQVLFDAGDEMQFALEPEENDPDSTYLNYSYVSSKKLVQE